MSRTGLQNIGKTGEKIYVAMSSGVDSSTCAALLAKAYGTSRVRGVFMNNWSSTAKCSERDWKQVQQVADHIGIDCHRVNFERDYWTEVFEPMISMYQRGVTPNPDVACNRQIKFGSLIDHLKSRDPSFKWLASGHYAGINNSLVCRPAYLKKDQSYYLSTVSPNVLKHILFPLAELTKPQVRELATEFNLPTASKPDSQGLCFVEQSQKSFTKFLEEYLQPAPGNIILPDRTVVGKHRGLWTATIGQRASISMPQSNPEYRGQWFVAQKFPDTNEMVIVRGRDNPALFHDTVECKDFNWHRRPSSSDLFAQYRSLQEPEPLEGIHEDGTTTFKLVHKRRAISPGQYLAIYEKDVVIGAGIISNAY